MCGLAGIAYADARGVSREALARMGAAIRHRGPDGSGIWSDDRVGLIHMRLSIIDVATGAQPMANEDGRVIVAFNGEIYNYVELRSELCNRGHRFRTLSDTEVLVHGWEEWGTKLLDRLNGMFAIALYDRRDGTLFLARDRFGKRPLFWAERRGGLYFASEVKALFAHGAVEAAPCLQGLDETFTFWAARAPRTVFEGVCQLEPGSYAIWREGRLTSVRWWAPSYDAEMRDEPVSATEQLDALLRRSVTLRMRADVPVGGYLSGGLDSSITCALAASLTPHDLRSFSITFADPRLDESEAQQTVADALGTRHSTEHITGHEIATVFPDVVGFAETPLVRTAPAPMYLLARLARSHGIKVVLSGEGADELFLGYDLFKETSIRLFCQRQPQSRVRPLLFDRLYPYLAAPGRGGEFWRQFFLTAGAPDDPLASHLPRFGLTARIKEFYSPGVRDALASFDALDELRQALPGAFGRWSPLNRAAYLETTTLLPSYLLSSQGDRMAMAHGVELRSPFLDIDLAEYAASLPTSSKLRGLREKEILRRWARHIVPKAVLDRPKQPYRAPDIPSFFGLDAPDYVRELLDTSALKATGLFDPRAVAGLVRRCEARRATGFAENQALVAILSTQLWHHTFMARSRAGSAAATAGESRDASACPDFSLMERSA